MELDKAELEVLVARVAQDEVSKVLGRIVAELTVNAEAISEIEYALEALGLDPDEEDDGAKEPDSLDEFIAGRTASNPEFTKMVAIASAALAEEAKCS